MNKANNNDDSQSEKYNLGHHSGGHQFQFSPVTNPPTQENNEDNEVYANNADYNNPTAAGEGRAQGLCPRRLG